MKIYKVGDIVDVKVGLVGEVYVVVMWVWSQCRAMELFKRECRTSITMGKLGGFST